MLCSEHGCLRDALAGPFCSEHFELRLAQSRVHAAIREAHFLKLNTLMPRVSFAFVCMLAALAAAMAWAHSTGAIAF